MPVADERAPIAAGEPHRAAASLPRIREALAGACACCPEREGALRRELLCRCPVALGLRLLVRVERGGADPSDLSPSERASLDFQERALARRRPPLMPGAVEQAERLLGGVEHDDCEVSGCLLCRARSVVTRLAEQEAG